MYSRRSLISKLEVTLSVLTSRRAAVWLMMIVAFFGSQASAASVTNGSFESPDTVFAEPGATDWTTTGDTAGVFQNLDADTEFPPGSGIIARRVTNAEGSQLAFIGANDPLVGPGNEFSQLLTDVYLAGETYQLSVGVGISSVQPPDTGSFLRLMLFYLDDLSVRQPVAEKLITNNAETALKNNMLDYFTTVPIVVAPGAPYANRQIGVLISAAGNSDLVGGSFNLDNVTVVPEPATAGLVVLAALLAGRRGRRGDRR